MSRQRAAHAYVRLLEPRRTSVVLGASVALHLMAGTLAVLAVRPAPVTADVPPVQMVFEAAPPDAALPSEPALAAPEPPALPPPVTPPEPPLPDPVLPETAPQPTPPPPPNPAVPAQTPPVPVQSAPALPAPLPLPAPARPPPPRPPAPRPRPAPRPQPSALPDTPAPYARPADAPRAAPAPVPAAAVPATVNGAWRSALAAWMQSRKRYPDEARRQGAEGQVAVRFTVSRDGQVLDVQVVRSSGSDLLDQAVLSMLQGSRAPPFPADMVQPQITTTISIRYRLQE